MAPNTCRSERARVSWWRRCLGWGGAFGCLLWAGVAGAHPTPGSVGFVDFTVDGARLAQDVPIEELERALHLRLFEDGDTAIASVHRNDRLLRGYALEHLRVASAGSERPWSARVVDLQGHDASDGPRARFLFELAAPRGEAAESVLLQDDIVAHEVVSHYTSVYVRSDWAQGMHEAEPRLVGMIHAGRNSLTVTRNGSFALGLRSVVALGMDHIATGTDHLLFLFALVLVAPVAAVAGSWRPRESTRDTLVSLAGVVSAFTLGHSATLALGVLGGVTLSSVAVEAAIAASILVTAAHAVRPLFPRREALVAGSFGLVHGLAFSSTLTGRDLGHAQAAWTLLGFNTGIELAQLGLLALVVPWLLVIARTRAYAGFRVTSAALAFVLGACWLAERTLDVANPFARPLAALQTHPLALLFALAAIAVLARVADGIQPRSLEPR